MEEHPVDGSETFSSRAFISTAKEKDKATGKPAQCWDKKYSRSIAAPEGVWQGMK